MKMTERLKERFVRDCKIPIRLYAEPYFTERLELLNKFYDTKTKWQAFCDEVEKFPNEEEYFAMYNSTKEAAMQFIQTQPAWLEFNKLDMNQFATQNKNLPAKDIFKPSNIGGEFISIDMKKANFSSLRYFDKSIFDYAETWEDFIHKFTDSDYITTSKYIREVIMGNCNPKRVITYEKFITDGILTSILATGIEICDIVFFSNDEIIVEITNLDKETTYNKIVEVVKRTEVPLRIERFTLSAVTKNNKIIGYIKNLIDGTYDFKCFNNQDLLLVMRKLHNEEIRQSDLVFENEGFLAKYIDIPVINFIKEVTDDADGDMY